MRALTIVLFLRNKNIKYSECTLSQKEALLSEDPETWDSYFNLNSILNSRTQITQLP